MFGWLLCWLLGWCGYWSVGWFVAWLADESRGCLVDWSIWLAGCLVKWSAVRFDSSKLRKKKYTLINLPHYNTTPYKSWPIIFIVRLTVNDDQITYDRHPALVTSHQSPITNHSCALHTCVSCVSYGSFIICQQALELDRHFEALRTLAKDSPDFAKIVSDLETGTAKARELQVNICVSVLVWTLSTSALIP